jgi:5-methylcytosine-specific restriction enzyme A
MAEFDPGLVPGQVLTCEDLERLFTCGGESRVRGSHGGNALVVVSDLADGPAADRWEGSVLHYAGLGVSDARDLASDEERTLAESASAGVKIFLFEKFGPDRYLFDGEVTMADVPRAENRVGDDGQPRLVSVSSLQLTGQSGPPALPVDALERIKERHERETRYLSTAELERRAALSVALPAGRLSAISVHLGDPYVAELAKRRAQGHCQLCGEPAPFRAKGGRPFLEVHHIHWLSRGGTDTPENTAAVCPNCHRRLHVLDQESDRERLRQALLGQRECTASAHPLAVERVSDQAIDDFVEAFRAEGQAQALRGVGGEENSWSTEGSQED